MSLKCPTLGHFLILLAWVGALETVSGHGDLTLVRALERKERLQCYLCSWSVMGPGNDTEYDICSTGNFVRDAVPVVGCEYGCQTVSFRISEKEDIRNFYRNCLKSDDGKDLDKDRCYNQKTAFGLEQRCTCLSNLCNRSSSIKFLGPLLLIPLAINGDLSSALLQRFSS